MENSSLILKLQDNSIDLDILYKRLKKEKCNLDDSYDTLQHMDQTYKTQLEELRKENCSLSQKISNLNAELLNANELLSSLQCDINNMSKFGTLDASTQTMGFLKVRDTISRNLKEEMDLLSVDNDVADSILVDSGNASSDGCRSDAASSSTSYLVNSKSFRCNTSFERFNKISIIGDSFAFGLRSFLEERLPSSCKVSADIFPESPGASLLFCDKFVNYGVNDCIIICLVYLTINFTNTITL
ncbi:hypothetical protein O3M35_004977 [Rhynocoris fuscipes]|uniref:Uncharacterized protein n=1 Tax=Rhynocoris fuscipes TaxID=488301 RepID=A0AAW1DKA1_9HEMI